MFTQCQLLPVSPTMLLCFRRLHHDLSLWVISITPTPKLRSSSRNRQSPAPWLQYLDDHFVNGITTPGDNPPSVTFQRARLNFVLTTSSCPRICCLLYNINTATPHTYSHLGQITFFCLASFGCVVYFVRWQWISLFATTILNKCLHVPFLLLLNFFFYNAVWWEAFNFCTFRSNESLFATSLHALLYTWLAFWNFFWE